MRRILLVIAVAFAAAAGPVQADDDDRREREEATDARRRGEILPLAEILELVRERTGSRIVEVEYERDDGVPAYEIYFIDEKGRRREITVDARDGQIIDADDD
jgi:uncharacterized membrane protein YkoI